MAAQTTTPIYALAGLVLWGDLGPLTMYRAKSGKLVIFKKTYPDKPPTPRQIASRDSMNCCGRSWQGLLPAERAGWRLVAKTLSLPCSGYNLWVAWRFKQNPAALRTLERQSGVELKTNAYTTNVYDPRWRPIQTRRKDSYPDPGIFLMPHAPVVAAEQTCTLWVMPWMTDLNYWEPVAYTFELIGDGTATCAPMRNRTMIPIWYTAPNRTGSASIHLTTFWPDGQQTLIPIHLITDPTLS
jgi:hypothetical protein